MKNLSFLILLFCIVFNSTFSQVWQIDWQQCYGGSENDYATDIIQIDGGYLVTGHTSSTDGDVTNNDGGGEGWLIQIDSISNLMWEKTYGGTSGERFVRIHESSTGDYYLIGSSSSSNGDVSYNPYPNSINFWIVKIDSAGIIIWDRIVGGYGGDFIVDAIHTTDDGIIAIGYSNSDDGDITIHYGQYDMWMIKLNSEGETEWDFTIGNSSLDYPGAIIQTTDGGYLVGGSSKIMGGGNLTCESHGNADAVVIKLDSLRNIEWQQCYGGSEYDGATVLLELEDGYLFAGYAGSNDGNISGWHGYIDIWVVRIDLWGNIIWQKCLGGGAGESSYYLLQTEDMGFYVIGVTQSSNGDVTNNHSHPGKHDIWLVKLTSDGEIQWQQCFGGDRDEMVQSGVLYKGDNNFVIAGQTEKVSGDVLCDFHGWLERDDYWVFEITMPDTTTVTNLYDETGFRVYPNPARDYVVFELHTPTNKNAVIPTTGGRRNPTANSSPLNQRDSSHSVGMTTLDGSAVVIVNVFGQEVTSLLIKSEKTVWDTRKVKNGIYFYMMEIEEEIYSGKIVVQK